MTLVKKLVQRGGDVKVKRWWFLVGEQIPKTFVHVTEGIRSILARM